MMEGVATPLPVPVESVAPTHAFGIGTGGQIATETASIVRLDSLDEHWDTRVAANPDSTFFHGASWPRVLRDTYGFSLNFFVRRDGAAVRAVLPLMEVDSWLTGRRGISLPFADECPPLDCGGESSGALFDAACVYGKTRGWKYLELRGGERTKGASPSTSYWGHRIDLRAPNDALFARVSSSGRRAVRKAIRSGLTFEITREFDGIRCFYGLLSETRRRLGVPIQPARFFESIHRHIIEPKRGCVLLARLKGKPVAGAVLFHWGRRALYKFAASAAAYRDLRPNNLILWRAIEWHAMQGFDSIDLGRTSLANEGLRAFKRGWGAEERRIDYARYDLEQDTFVTSRDHSSTPYNWIFRHLPVGFGRLVGTALYRHVA